MWQTVSITSSYGKKNNFFLKGYKVHFSFISNFMNNKLINSVINNACFNFVLSFNFKF